MNRPKMTSALNRHGRSGQILMLGTISLVFLFSAMGLAVDVGYGYMLKRRAQTAADAAAVGAGVYARVNGDACGVNATCGTAYTCANPPVSPPVNSLQAGCLYAKQNGFLSDGTTKTISLIENNTSLGSGLAPSIWIKATVSQKFSNLFMMVAGATGGTSASTATAGVAGNPNAQCAYALGTASGGGIGLSDSGSGNINLSGCGLYSNNGVNQSGSGSITATNGSIYTYGTNSYHAGKVSPVPTPETSPVADPLATLTLPTVPSTCTNTNFNTSSGGPLSAGVYCGGMKLSGGTPYTLGSGIYYIVGGGVSISASAGVSGSGVMFYLTCNSTYSAHASSLTGSGSVSVNAPTSGPYIGILMFQDPNCPTGATTISGSATANSSGALYFPTTELDFSGSGGSNYLSLIAFSLKFTGSGDVGLQRDPSGTVIGLRNTWLMQ